MEQRLRQFNDDGATKDALLDFLTAFFEDQIVVRAKKGEDVKGLVDAIKELERGFEELADQYGVKPKNKETINTRR